MSLQDKYREVLNLVKIRRKKMVTSKKKMASSKWAAQSTTQYEKNILWDKIKEIGGDKPADLKADIKAQDTEYFHIHG